MASNRESNGRFKKGSHWRQPQKHWSKDWLETQYINLQRSMSDIAGECGCRESAIAYWLAKHGIPRRTTSQSRSVKHWGQSGPANPMYGKYGAANPNWNGGISPERQKIHARYQWRAVRQEVLRRDENKCVRCGSGRSVSKSIHMHHIKSWAKNPEYRFDLANIVTLCRQCHQWVHSKENTAHELLAH